MHWKLAPSIDFTKSNRIDRADAQRQQDTAAEIVKRLNEQPGIVLADEVGMGKTYVALAVAVSIVEATQRKRPVVVMVPRGVADKWHSEWEVFTKQCMTTDATNLRISQPLTAGSDFLKLLDDPPHRRKHIVLLTHGAITSNLKDPFVKLSLLRQATLHRTALLDKRDRIAKAAPVLLQDKRFGDAELVLKLLKSPESQWKAIWEHNRPHDTLDDDPVPENLPDLVSGTDLDTVRDTVANLPKYRNSSYEARVRKARTALNNLLRGVWQEALRHLDARLPLLILDEAHHVKNQTKLADLLSSKDAHADLDSLKPGELGSVFERMLFLTATPFQLGHHELLSVMRRFDGVRWTRQRDRDRFMRDMDELSDALDAAQTRNVEFEQAWKRLPIALNETCRTQTSFDLNDGLDPALQSVLTLGRSAESAVHEANTRLRPWVIRHLRARRRDHLAGASIAGAPSETGLAIPESSSLPFLLAARAQALSSLHRKGSAVGKLYAYGLASSFEAYRSTRSDDISAVRDEIGPVDDAGSTPQLDWYVQQIDNALPAADANSWVAHPKMKATVDKTVELWLGGHKVLVFCYYRRTGEALRQRISDEMRRSLYRRAAEALGIDPHNEGIARQAIDQLSDRLLRSDSSGYRRLHAEILAVSTDLRQADPDSADTYADRVARFMRSDSFLVNFTELQPDLTADQLIDGFRNHQLHGETLRDRVGYFASYLAERESGERHHILEELRGIMTGDIRAGSVSDDEQPAHLLPNVRLANGAVSTQQRQRLMTAFNTPFFPDVLVASQVMSEGVNLHTYCRHIIHHDLDWNPANLEQRTGRVDRIGSLAERFGKRIEVYEPYLAGTHDEKMFRVVKDRERWFGIVMGVTPDGDQLAESADGAPELPRALAERLTMNLALRNPPAY